MEKIKISDLSLNKLANWNNYLLEDMKKIELFDLLESNKKDIKEFIYPDFRSYSIEKDIKEIEDVLDILKSKYEINYYIGWLYFFGLTKDNLEGKEYFFSIPSYKDSKPNSYLEIKLKNTKLNRNKIFMLKQMFNTNKVKVDFNLEDNEEEIKTKFTNKYSYNNKLFWGTIRVWVTKGLRLKK